MILADAERIARYTARGWWGGRTIDDVFRAGVAAHPDREAVVDAPNRPALTDGVPRRLDWRQLGDEVARMAALLRDEGCRRDDVVVVQLASTVEQAVVALALLRLGCVVSPVPVQFREPELRHVLATSGATAVVTASRIGRLAAAEVWCRLARETAGEGERDLQVFAFGREVPFSALPLDVALAGVDPDDAVETQGAGLTANDIATVCWSAGAETVPKGVPRSHNEWLAIAPSVVAAAELAPGTRFLTPFPLVDMAGWSTFTAWLALGGTLVHHHPFELEVFLGQLRTERIDYTVAPPAIVNRMLQDADRLEGIDFARLRRIGCATAPLSEWMVAGWADRGVEIVHHFGSNEGVALTGSPRDIAHPALRARCVAPAGVAATAGLRTRLVDPDTGETIAGPGRPGELRVAGPTVFTGYFHAPELTARAFDDEGFYRSGDLFEIAGDRQELYRFVGRAKDIVVRGTVKIPAAEVEALLLGHPDVAEAAVVGVPDAALGERVGAAVVARAGRTPTLEALVAWLADAPRVAGEEWPERLLVVDALPRDCAGKVLKRELRQRFAAAPILDRIAA